MACATSKKPTYDERDPCIVTRRHCANRTDEAILTNIPCNNKQGVIIHIGLKTNGGVEPKIKVCFDQFTYRTFWTRHTLHHTWPSGTVPYNWSNKFFDGLNISDLYRSLPETDKGHLTPVADFNKQDEKNMTLYYINSAPQRRGLNREAWVCLERRLRKTVNNQSRSATIITGTGGVFGIFNKTLSYTTYRYPAYFFKIFLLPTRNPEIYIGVNTPPENERIPESCRNATVPHWLTRTYRNKLYQCAFDEKLMADLGLEKQDYNTFSVG